MKHWRAWLFAAPAILAALSWWLWPRLANQKKQERGNLLDPLILRAAKEYRLDPALIKAVIWRESQFDASAMGKAGEIGLMQLTDAAAYEWADASQIVSFNPKHLYNPETNTLAGCYYLAKMIRSFPNCDDPIPYALASYNAGRQQVRRWRQGVASTNAAQFIRQIAFPSTKQYVQSILRQRRRFEQDFQ